MSTNSFLLHRIKWRYNSSYLGDGDEKTSMKKTLTKTKSETQTESKTPTSTSNAYPYTSHSPSPTVSVPIPVPIPIWSPCPVLRILLLGTHPKNYRSGLRHLRGQTNTLLRTIYTMVLQLNTRHVLHGPYNDPNDDDPNFVRKTLKEFSFHQDEIDPAAGSDSDIGPLLHECPGKFFLLDRGVKFPDPKDININMMPFLMGREKDTLPEHLHTYIPMIKKCYAVSDMNKICYLTIDERMVKKGNSQRGAGLHVESVPLLRNDGDCRCDSNGFCDIFIGGWGAGEHVGKELHGGIYMASTVKNTTRVWDSVIEEGEDVIGPYGNIEHLRSSMRGKGYLCDANELIWMTNMTPHESVPVEEDCYRQYFRVVGPEISVWYSQHNTANPLLESVLGYPFSDVVNVVNGNKFDDFDRLSDQITKSRERKLRIRKDKDKDRETDKDNDTDGSGENEKVKETKENQSDIESKERKDEMR